MTKMCMLVRPMHALKDQVIYGEGLVGSSMYFIVDGEVEITKNDERLGFLATGAFFGEQPIIEIITKKGGDGSELRARTVRAMCDTHLGVVESSDVLELVDQYPELPIRLGHFVKMGVKLPSKGKNRAEMTRDKATTLYRVAEEKFGQQNKAVVRAPCMHAALPPSLELYVSIGVHTPHAVR